MVAVCVFGGWGRCERTREKERGCVCLGKRKEGTQARLSPGKQDTLTGALSCFSRPGISSCPSVSFLFRPTRKWTYGPIKSWLVKPQVSPTKHPILFPRDDLQGNEIREQMGVQRAFRANLIPDPTSSCPLTQFTKRGKMCRDSLTYWTPWDKDSKQNGSRHRRREALPTSWWEPQVKGRILSQKTNEGTGVGTWGRGCVARE